MSDQILIALIGGLTPLLSVMWVIYSGRKTNTEKEEIRRRDEINNALERQAASYKAEMTRVYQQMADEKSECREAITELKARNATTEGRLHELTHEYTTLQVSHSELRGKQFIMEQVIPQINILASFQQAGGRRRMDPPPGQGAHGNEGIT